MGASTTTSSRYGQPALIGGLVTGVLSALPLVSAGNLCCCLWVVAGGLVAAYVLQQNQSTPIRPGDGALAGLLSGFVGSLVMFGLSIPISILVAPIERAIIQRSLEMAGTMPPELRGILENYGQPRTDIGLVARGVIRIFFLFIFLVVSSFFSTLGGLLGAALFVRHVPPPPAAELTRTDLPTA